MRLEIEMSDIHDTTRTLIDHDLEQVDHSINTLIEYARASSATIQNGYQKCAPVLNISQALMDLITCETEQSITQAATLTAAITANLHGRIEPFSLQRIFANLIENAKRYGRNSAGVAEIFVRLDQQAQALRLEISDTGCGITAQESETFMRPFSRGNQARTDCIGTGLGLAIAERLVTQSHGTIHLISRPRKGLLVRIMLPAHSPHA
jgi:two-component system osmolarity sensor histidine kinase EnvZ